MFYMVNPSSLPKRKKSKRRNPELLIVNPYSLEDKNKGSSKMAKKRRKNPMSLRKRRRNPDVQAAVREVAGEKGRNILNAAVAAVAGGASLAIGSKLLGERVGQGSVGQGVLAIASGVGGGAVALMAANALGPGAVGNFLRQAAVPGALGAMTLGFWKIAQGPVEGWLGERGLAGLGSWQKEFEGLGQSYYDEFTPGVSPGMSGLGQPVVAATDLLSPEDNPFLSGYEPLGDIYNTQRLGSFESERGLAGFVPETPNPRDQQVADVMKNAAGDYGNYGGYEGTLFEPIIESD